MFAMQYEIPLPADYDMGIIRHRVASRGHATNAYPDLVLVVSVGNECMVSWAGNPVSPAQMASYITQVRSAVSQPVTTDDRGGTGELVAVVHRTRQEAVRRRVSRTPGRIR